MYWKMLNSSGAPVMDLRWGLPPLWGERTTFIVWASKKFLLSSLPFREGMTILRSSLQIRKSVKSVN